MKKLLFVGVLLLAAEAKAAPFTVVNKPFEIVRVASVTVPSLSTAAWRSDIYGQYSVTFQNVTSTPVYIGTYPTITNNLNTYPLLSIGATLTLPVHDNVQWYFYGMGASNIRILYSK